MEIAAGTTTSNHLEEEWEELQRSCQVWEGLEVEPLSEVE